jgi:hypothetical protein
MAAEHSLTQEQMDAANAPSPGMPRLPVDNRASLWHGYSPGEPERPLSIHCPSSARSLVAAKRALLVAD